MPALHIDEIDAKILNLLQSYGRIKRKAIAEQVGLTVPSVSERLRKLEERGIVLGYHAFVEAKSLNYDIAAFIRVTVDTSSHYGSVIDHLCASQEVLEVHSITGEGSHIVKVRTRDTVALERLLSHIQSLTGVTGTSTSIVLSTFKESQQVVAEPTSLPRR